MAKNINYPRASFKRAFELAQTVDSLGGESSPDICAQKMNNRMSGAFRAIISSSVKHGLITSSRGKLATTELFKEIKLAYTDEEKRSFLLKAFLNPEVYFELFKKFESRDLPVQILGKILIKEYEVNENIADKVAGYFLKGAKFIGILQEGKLISMSKDTIEGAVVEESNIASPITKDDVVQSTDLINVGLDSTNVNSNAFNTDNYSCHITGPNINSNIIIKDEDDLMIVEITLKKIKKILDLKKEEK